MNVHVGIDFDNTIVSYDDLAHSLAVERGLIPESTPASKQAVRDRIRLLPAGDVEWQRIQVELYGDKMNEAALIPGVVPFIRICREGGIPVSIVSHKTERPDIDPTGPNLRDAALNWMDTTGFFLSSSLTPGDVYFEPTRDSKVDRIADLGCTVFIDDLIEVFREPGFPIGVTKILFSPTDGVEEPSLDFTVASSWNAISELVLV